MVQVDHTAFELNVNWQSKSFGLVWGSVKWPPGAGLHSSNKTGWMSALALLGWWHHKYRQAYHHHHHHHIIYKPLLLGSPYGIGQTIIFSSCGFFFFYLSFFFPRLISAVADWMSAISINQWFYWYCSLYAGLVTINITLTYTIQI